MIIVTSIVISSCRKELPDSKFNSKGLLLESREYFVKNFNNKIIKDYFKNKVNLNEFQKLNKTLIWNQATEILINGKKSIKIPINYEANYHLKIGIKESIIDLRSLSYLLISKDTNNLFSFEWIITIPDDDYFNKTNVNKKFSGKILVNDWFGNTKGGYKISGDEIDYLNNLEWPQKQIYYKKNLSLKQMSTNCQDVVLWRCEGFESGIYCERINLMVCFGSEKASIGSGSSSGSSGRERPSSGPRDYPTPILYRDTINNLNNKDANCIFERLKSNALFQNLLANFQNNKNLNVTFQMGSPVDLKGNPVAGQTHYDYGTTNFTITIDNNYFALRGGIEVAKTFLHEAFHANLYTQAQLWYPSDLPNNFQNWSLVEQIKYLDNRGNNSSAQHDYMAYHIDEIASALQAYTLANYPSIYNNPNATFDSYRAMAYGGLTGTDCYTTYVNSLANGQDGFNAAYQKLITVSGENKCP